MVGLAGVRLLTQTVTTSGLDTLLVQALEGCRAPWASHHPAKVLLDLALAAAAGGDCLADTALLRGQESLVGAVASAATVTRVVRALAAGIASVEVPVARARATARSAGVVPGRLRRPHGGNQPPQPADH